MPVTRAMAKRTVHQLSVDQDEGRRGERKRKESSVVSWLDRNNHPLMNDVVLANLFKYVQVTDLKSCRLVSKKWNRASLPFVRASFSVSISGTNITCQSPEMKGVQYFVQFVGANTLGIPFAKYRLGAFDTTKGAGQQFLQVCGKTATEIMFNNDEHMIEDIARLLRSTPKLEHLVLPNVMTSKDRNRSVVNLFPEDIKPKLPFLMSVNVSPEFGHNPTEITKKCPTFYEELFEVAENISTLDLTSFSPKLELKILGTIAKFGRMQFIKNLRFRLTVEKTLSPEHLDLLKGMKLEHLGLELSFLAVIVDWFQLVALSRNTLTSLTMDIATRDPSALVFQLMPKLKELNLVIFAVNNLGRNFNNISHTFPSLEKLNIHLGLMFSTGNELNFLIGDESRPCPHMKSLIIRQRSMEMDTFNRIRTIFPSLKVFKCKIRETVGVEVINGIWTHMTQLEDLSISATLESTVNLDSLVTGIPVEEFKRMDMKEFLDSLQQQNMEIRRERILLMTNKHGQLPSIRNLTNLRSLELDLTTMESGGRKARHLTDVSAYLGFHSLKNLRHLSALHCEISKDCMDVLVKDMGLHTWTFLSS